MKAQQPLGWLHTTSQSSRFNGQQIKMDEKDKMFLDHFRICGICIMFTMSSDVIWNHILKTNFTFKCQNRCWLGTQNRHLVWTANCCFLYPVRHETSKQLGKKEQTGVSVCVGVAVCAWGEQKPSSCKLKHDRIRVMWKHINSDLMAQLSCTGS